MVNSRLLKVPRLKMASDVVTRHKRRLPMKICTSASVKGVVSDDFDPEVYSPGLSRKKKARTTMCAIAKTLVIWDAKAIAITCLMTLTGIGFTRLGGGSSRLYAAHILFRRKSILLLRL